MNMRGVFLHLLADALGSVIVIVSALVRIVLAFSNLVFYTVENEVIFLIIILFLKVG